MKSNRPLKYIAVKAKPFVSKIVWRSIIGILASVALFSFAVFSGSVLDICTGEKQGNLTLNIILLFAAILLHALLTALNVHLSAVLTGRLKMHFQKSVFKGFTLKQFDKTSKYHSGDILNRLTDDINIITNSVSSIIPTLCSFVAKIAIGVTALVIFSPSFALIAIVGGLIVPTFGRLISAKYKFLHKQVQKSNGVTRSFLQECLENMSVVKSFSSFTPIENRLDGFLEDNYKLKIKRNNLHILTHSGLHTVFSLIYYVILVLGAFSIAKGDITYGVLIAILQIVNQLRMPLQNVSGILPQYYSALASAERLLELEDIEDEEKPIDSDKLENFAQGFKEIKAENLSFSYNEEKVIFDSLNFSIERGDTVALRGESGRGKTTLFKLLLGLYSADNGGLFVDDKKLTSAYRKLFAYVPQGNMILSGSIRENISLNRENLTEEELISACKTAEIYDYISSLPDGFDTVLSERGAGLSEGQVQRLAIARALVSSCPILLLDESTSALDEKTEKAVLKNLSELKDKTILIITHRESVLDICNKTISL